MQRFIDNRELEEMEKHQREGSPYGGKSGGGGAYGDRASSESPDQKVSFADFRRQKARDQFHSSAINITYTEQEKEDPPKRANLLQRRDSYKEQAAANRLSTLGTPVQSGSEPQSGYDSAGSAGKRLWRRNILFLAWVLSMESLKIKKLFVTPSVFLLLRGPLVNFFQF